MVYAFGCGLFIIASFMWLAGQLHLAHRFDLLQRQLDELIYNLAGAEDAGEDEQAGG